MDGDDHWMMHGFVRNQCIFIKEFNIIDGTLILFVVPRAEDMHEIELWEMNFISRLLPAYLRYSYDYI
jgi:hypothetical protein